jgi:hypothetical protein
MHHQQHQLTCGSTVGCHDATPVARKPHHNQQFEKYFDSSPFAPSEHPIAWVKANHVKQISTLSTEIFAFSESQHPFDWIASVYKKKKSLQLIYCNPVNICNMLQSMIVP